MKEWLTALKDWVPFLQTASWVGLAVFLTYKFSEQIESMATAFRNRINSGSSFKAGPVELGEDLRSLEKVSANTKDAEISKDGWITERDSIYQRNHGIFLAHILEPSNKPGQLFDIFIYLVRHKSGDFSDVDSAEFFFGSYWNNRIFKEENRNGMIGVATSAYGPFLCTCKVHLRNGEEIKLQRYIDFEMKRAFKDTKI